MIRFAGKTFVVRLVQIAALVARFRTDRRGNIAVITALAALPMVSAVGCVIDYSNASMIRAKLQSAADAASLATVSTNSTVVNTAQAMTKNGTVAGGTTYATNFFTANLPAGYTTVTPTVSVTLTGLTMTATVSFSTQVPTYFMGVIGYKNITVSGSSTSTYSMPAYINFYLMLDVSGSMGFPSTTAEQQRLMAVNPDDLQGSLGYSQGCQFACHFTYQGACAQTGNPYQGPIPAAGKSTNPGTGGYCQGFIISRLGTTPTSFASGTTNITNGNNVNWNNTPVTTCSTPGTTSCIQLRADAVGYAVNSLLATAYASETAAGISNQFKVGLYPFIVNLYTYFALTTSINGSATSSGTINYAAAQLATLLDTGVNTSLGSGGTHFENAFPSMNSLITSVGTGASSSNALPYVFLITDGSQDCQTQSGNGTNWGGDAGCSPYYNSATTLNAATLCTPLKNRGITVAVLYIPYGQIVNPNPSFSNDEDGYANSNIANIPASLQACASPNFFYTANTPADITSALITMFEQAVSTAHVSN
jgi:Flp pilus assembly protein TadG